MNSHRAYQHCATAGAVLLTAVAVACATHQLYPHAASFGLGALVLGEAAVRERRLNRRRQLEHEWARRRAVGEHPAPLNPCCLLGRASKGQAHDRDCTNPEHTLLLFLNSVAKEQQNPTASHTHDAPGRPEEHA